MGLPHLSRSRETEWLETVCLMSTIGSKVDPVRVGPLGMVERREYGGRETWERYRGGIP